MGRTTSESNPRVPAMCRMVIASIIQYQRVPDPVVPGMRPLVPLLIGKVPILADLRWFL